MSKLFLFLTGGLSGAAIVWLVMYSVWLTPLRREHTHMRESLTDAAEQLTLDAIHVREANPSAATSMHLNADRLHAASMYQAPALHEGSGK
ncbi:MAG: hypothetical protein IT462_16425 [Planctomycetes bacterium]|nr:hypothetical protein [Planctomycetota bacterium]